MKMNTITTYSRYSSNLRLFKLSIITLFFAVSIFNAQAGKRPMGIMGSAFSPISEILISEAGHNLLLSWQIDKSAFNYFEVERSYDGKTFSTIGLVLDAPENSNTCLFKDKKSTGSTGLMIWYRIKGIVKNGSIIYSPSSSYKEYIPVPVDITNATFSPNPFSNTGFIKYFSNQAGIAEIKLQNAAGETLLSKQSILSKGYNNIQLGGLNKLASGIYVARLVINGMVIVNQKVVKE